MSIKIYFPTIHLFAYSRIKKSDSLLEIADDMDSDWLWKKCNQIIKAKLSSNFDLKSFLQNDNRKVPAENLINQELTYKDEQIFIHIPEDRKIHSYHINDYFPIYIKIGIDTKTTIHPLRLYDSYALGLNFYPPIQLSNKKFYIEEIKQYNINPANCLALSQGGKEPFLGQTILITAKITGKYKRKSLEWLKNNIADQYLEILFPEDTNFRKPRFNKAGKLLDRPIFEYGIFRQLDNYIHVLVWLIDNKDEKNIVEKSYSKMIGLFLFRAKIINAYKETRKYSKRRNLKLEYKLEDVVMGLSSRKKIFKGYNSLILADINDDLIGLTQMSFRYANMLRNIEEHQNTIVYNTQNYTDKIREIESVFHDETLEFLSFFGERNCRYFKDQLAVDLRNVEHGLEVVNNAINGIQGMLKIVLHETEQQYDSKEKEFDRNLSVLIFAAASGLGAAELASSNFSAIKKDSFVYDQPFINRNFIEKYPYTSAITYSFLFSFLVGFIIWIITTLIVSILVKIENKKNSIPLIKQLFRTPSKREK